MNCLVHTLPELESATSHVREALQAILHTILFIRSPGPVSPHDVHCDGFQTTYTRISPEYTCQIPQQRSLPSQFNAYNRYEHIREFDRRVDDAIEMFLRTLTPIGPELMAGCLTLSFFERKAKNKLFGLVHQEEKVVWEQWILRVVVNNTPRPMGEDEASMIERQRIQDTAEGMLRAVLFRVIQLSGNEIDHIPSVMYDFDISNTKRPDDRDEVYSRVSNMPALINLGS